MVDRGLPIVDGAPACPFVAFEDERDERATAPDHRHRCYAEPRPAPRALAHQDAYCLSSNFPVCPTFQDWARREAAGTRPGSAAPAFDPRPEPEAAPERHPMPPPDREARHGPGDPLPPRRNPPRAWAAPPPWSPGSGPRPTDDETDTPGFGAPRAADGPPEARGLAGSAADRLAGGRSPVDDRLAADDAFDGPFDGEADDAADLVAGTPARGEPIGAPPIPRYVPPAPDDTWPADDDDARYAPPSRRREASERSRDDDDRYAPPSRRSEGPGGSSRGGQTWSDPDADDDEDDDDRYAYAPPPPRRHVDRARDRGEAGDGRAAAAGERGRGREPGRRPPRTDGPELFGPAWERPRRYEAYPTLRSRMPVPMPGLSRVVVAVAALALGVLVLFFLPGLLNLGGTQTGSRPTATPSEAASPTEAPSPTATPLPTPIVHIVAQGETLSKIAKQYGLTLDQLLAANKQIKNPNKIAIGDQLNIPTPEPSNDLGSEESPSPSA